MRKIIYLFVLHALSTVKKSPPRESRVIAVHPTAARFRVSITGARERTAHVAARGRNNSSLAAAARIHTDTQPHETRGALHIPDRSFVRYGSGLSACGDVFHAFSWI